MTFFYNPEFYALLAKLYLFLAKLAVHCLTV